MASPGSVVIQFVADATKAARDAGKFALALGDVDREAGRVDGSLKDAQQAIDRTGDDARNSATDLGRAEEGLDQLGTEADSVADQLRRSGQEMAASIRNASTDVRDDAGHMRNDLGELGRESGAEFIGNIAEGIGSGQANLNDVVSGTLGGLTNLAATLTGPVGIAAGAAAAGIGLVFAAVKAESERAKEAIDTLRGAMQDVWEEGQKAQQEAIFDTWVEGAQETTGKLENTRDVLAQANVTADEFKAALAGDPAAMDTVKRKIDAQADAIEEAKRQQGGVYDFQQKYLDNMGTVLGDLESNDKAIGAVRREHEAIEDLSGKTGGNIGDWNADKAIADAKELNEQLDRATRDRTVKVSGYTSGDWGPKPGGGSGYPAGPRTAARSAPAPTYVTINMAGAFNDPMGNARTIKRLLEGEDVRQGRERGQPLAVAW